MKKVYMTPAVMTAKYIEPEMLCQSTRFVSGGPNNPEDGGIAIPGTVGEVGEDDDPYDGHGQGSGGGGNRAPQRWGDLW